MKYQVDLDTLETVGRFFNKDIKERLVYKVAVPKFLELFERHNIKATFFVVGQDVGENKEILKEALARKHSIANHTYSHPFGFASLSRNYKLEEITKCHFVVKKHLGVEPVGFRSPGYDIDDEILGILAEMGYLYDSSIYPTPLSWVLRLYSKMKGGKTDGYGAYALSPSSPHFRELLEVPIPTFMRFPVYSTTLFQFPFLKPRYPFVMHGIDLIDYDLPECPTLNKRLEYRTKTIERALSYKKAK